MDTKSPAEMVYFTSAEVADKLKLNQQVIVRKLQTGEMPGYKLGKDWRVSDQQLAAWLEARSNQNRLDERAKVERSFFKDDRLVEIPAQRKKRIYVLERLIQEFDTARIYTEPEVNEVLRRSHSDFCTLRREFILEKMMVRKDGNYRRTGSYKFRE